MKVEVEVAPPPEAAEAVVEKPAAAQAPAVEAPAATPEAAPAATPEAAPIATPAEAPAATPAKAPTAAAVVELVDEVLTSVVEKAGDATEAAEKKPDPPVES